LQLEKGTFKVENQYRRLVKKEGNTAARNLMEKVFQITGRKWRGIGEIPLSGFNLRPEFSEHDADIIFGLGEIKVSESAECISGIILQGLKKPHECPAFGKQCTPQTPLGATMVSSEGTCAAYYSYSRYHFKLNN
jgi:hydrogenase expression/formation protein HypD